jgi:PAS domain S-box-containing protein
LRASAALRYSLAIVAVALPALLGTLEIFGGMRFSLFFFNACMVAWLLGTGPGIVTAIASVLTIDYFFLPPLYHIGQNDPKDDLRLMVFTVGVLVVNLTTVWWKKAHLTDYDSLRMALKNASDAQVLARAATEEREQRFQTLAELLQDQAVFVLSASGQILSANSATEPFTGHRPSQLVGRHFQSLVKNNSAAILDFAGSVGEVGENLTLVRSDGSHAAAHLVLKALRTGQQDASHRTQIPGQTSPFDISGFLAVIRPVVAAATCPKAHLN